MQADGIEIESNTTFTTDCTSEEDCSENAHSENETTCDVNTIPPNESETQPDAVDEFSTRSNPFTGLEDWAIVADEPMTDEVDFSDSQFEQNANETLSFNFKANFENSNNDLDTAEETDIFLSPPSCDAESDNSETIASDSFFNETTNTRNTNDKGKRNISNKSNSNKKSVRSSSASTNQTSLWG